MLREKERVKRKLMRRSIDINCGCEELVLLLSSALKRPRALPCWNIFEFLYFHFCLPLHQQLLSSWYFSHIMNPCRHHYKHTQDAVHLGTSFDRPP